MTTETLRGKTIRLAAVAGLQYWWQSGDEDYALFMRLLTNLVRLAQQEALEEERAALRKKIESAPVVAWLHPAGDLFNTYYPHSTPLISKEDLK